MNHIDRIVFCAEKYPTREHYPFCLPVFQQTAGIDLDAPVTFFVGENGAGKSTFLEAVARRCRIHIWGDEGRSRLERNPYECELYRFLRVHWTDGAVPGSFFAAQIFQHFADLLDRMAEADPGQLEYFGGKSLVTQSHGESLMSFFAARYRIKGLYLLDEPETALSPRTQVKLVRLLETVGSQGHAQFLICTHSPILLACRGATIYSFDEAPLRPVDYEQTDHYRLYRGFLNDREQYLGDS